jgi:histidinol-phosphate aminotransferase
MTRCNVGLLGGFPCAFASLPVGGASGVSPSATRGERGSVFAQAGFVCSLRDAGGRIAMKGIMSLAKRLGCETVLKMSLPYRSPKEFCKDAQAQVWLDTNELQYSYGGYSVDSSNYQLYPEFQSLGLRTAYAAYAGLAPEQVLAVRGADEGIELLIRAFCRPGVDRIVNLPPTYAMYHLTAAMFAVGVTDVPREADFGVNVARIKQVDDCKLVFICSPNNPTGNVLARGELVELLEHFRERAIIVVDEAYVELCPDAGCADLIDAYPNLVVIRTLSKAFGLAAIRCGFLLCNLDIADVIRRVMAPYPLAEPVAQIAMQALTPAGRRRMEEWVARTLATAGAFAAALAPHSCVRVVGQIRGNFLLVKFSDERVDIGLFARQGIHIRELTLGNGITTLHRRISIGTEDQMALLLDVFAEIERRYRLGSVAASVLPSAAANAGVTPTLRRLSAEALRETRPMLPELFARNAGLTPDAVALRFGAAQMSYGELHREVERIAQALAHQGLAPRDRIGIWLEPGFERVIALLAVLRLGAVACPLHLRLPANALVSLLGRSEVKALLSSDSLLQSLRAEATAVPGCRLLDVARCTDAVAVSEHPLPQPGWADLAYVVHTSGSTAAPKAVAMSHRALVHEIHWQVGQSDSDQAPTTLQFASLGFDVFLTEVLATLCEGGTLVIANEDMRGSSAQLYDAIERFRVERLLISRVVLQGLAEEAMRRGRALTSLREIMCTGEQLTITSEVRWLFRHHACLFYNEYGMSEAPVLAAHRLAGDPERWPDLPPAGAVAVGASVHILDEYLRPVAPGEVGEIYVAGDFLAEGYLGADEEALERFKPSAFGPGLMFKSGDVGRFSAAGELLLLGRTDSVVKLRGIRVGLGEVEAALRRHPMVQEAAVTRVGDERDPRLAAYVLLRWPCETYASLLREFLTSEVAAHAVPAHFVAVQAFPKTHSGKIDRRALPPPPTERPRIATPFIAARTAREASLLAVWKRVLGLDVIGVRDKFFDLGGTSLSMQMLLRGINDELQVELSIADLFDCPSVEALSIRIAATQSGADGDVGDLEVADKLLQRRRRRKALAAVGGGPLDERAP